MDEYWGRECLAVRACVAVSSYRNTIQSISTCSKTQSSHADHIGQEDPGQRRGLIAQGLELLFEGTGTTSGLWTSDFDGFKRVIASLKLSVGP